MRLASLLLALLLALAGCAASRPSAETSAPAADALVSAEALAALLGAPDVVVLHVARDRADYAAGHVPGAHFLPLAAVAEDREGLVNALPPPEALAASFRAVGVSEGTRVVLYGDLDGLAAARAFVALDVSGHPHAAVLDGGLAAWRAAGGAVTAEVPPAPAPGTFTPRPPGARIVDAEAVAAALGEAVLVDARPPEQYTGATPGTGVRRPGHLPGAASLFWKEDLRPDGTLRPLAELRARYAAHGAVPGRPVVTYCRTGVQASHAYLVARLLGLAPTLYDASYLDWSNHTTYPVETGP